MIVWRAISVLLVLAATGALADERKFDAVDRNGDGMVDTTEYDGNSMPSERFRAYDTNRDGRVDRVEWLRGRSAANTGDSAE